MNSLGLGENYARRQKLSEERNREYNKLKQELDNKLKNRFADKKSTQIRAKNEFAENVSDVKVQNKEFTDKNPHVEIEKPLRETTEDYFHQNMQKIPVPVQSYQTVPQLQVAPMPAYNYEVLSTILSKMDLLQSKVDEISQKQRREEPVNQEYSFMDRDYYFDLNQYMDNIDAAQNKLNSLENEYRKLKAEPDEGNARLKKNPAILRARNKSSEDLQTSLKLGGSRLGFEQQDSIKQKQEQYRHELEQQMAEKRLKNSRRSLTTEDNFYEKFPSLSNSKQIAKSERSLLTAMTENYKTPADQEYFLLATRDYFDSNKQVNFDPNSINNDLPPFIQPDPKLAMEFIQKDDKLKKTIYAEELRRQIDEANKRKIEMKKRELEFNRKKEKEIAEYDPFTSPQKFIKTQQEHRDQSLTDLYRTKDSIVNSEEKKPSFARGGHGIFGQPLTENQKTSAELYKLELKAQIDERKRLAEQAKKEADLATKKEAERFEIEQEKMRAELMKEQQDRIAASQAKKKEPAKVVPTPREIPKQMKTTQPNPRNTALDLDRLKSPDLLIGPPNELKRKSQEPFKDTEFLKEIKELKVELLSEKTKVEEALKNHGNVVQVFDERVSKIEERKKLTNKSIFDAAMGKKPVKYRHRRSSSEDDSLDDKDIEEFDELNQLLSIAQPDQTYTKLEHRQAEYLTMQNQYLQTLKRELSHRKEFNPKAIKKPQRKGKSSLQMKSDSKFIEIGELFKSSDSFSHDIRSLDSKSESSLNLEELMKRNELRIKRLAEADVYRVEEKTSSSDTILHDFLKEIESERDAND
ncbi:hypothetical protein Ciccas_005289 [Cichlidogyrus casuarinus]|uniref:Uncharacterized protein n=1 Tax=Cichlidogyrus casuarinus TaxID=1844966 RepID=A0ABD2QCP3_9PLAT